MGADVCRVQMNKEISSFAWISLVFSIEKSVELYNKGAKKDEKMEGSIRIVVGKFFYRILFSLLFLAYLGHH